MPTQRQLETIGPKAHDFTTEERRRGAERTNQIRRERGKSVRERFADRLQSDADKLYDTFIKATEQGDWRGAQALMAEAFGRPASQVELTGRLDNTLSIEVKSSLAVPVLEIEGEAIELPEDDDEADAAESA